MLKKKIFFSCIGTIFVILLTQWQVWAKAAPVLTLQKVLYLAKSNSRLLSEAQLQEIVAAKSINIAKANYYPTLDAAAIDSKGFPGSTGFIGVGGLMGSPYREGVAGGLVLQQTVYDFHRTAEDVKIAQYQTLYSKENSKVTEYEVKQLALQTFFDCASFKTQRDIWSQLFNESGVITTEASHFVKTGQRSIVDGYLSQAQTDKALTAKMFFNARLQEAIRELAIIMGLSAHNFTCPSLPNKLIGSIYFPPGINSSPLLKRARAGIKVASEKLKREKSDCYPKIVAEASVGGMETTRLVSNENYAVGVGIVMPIFNFRTLSEIKRAQAVVSAQKEDIAAAQQYLLEMNSKYDEIIVSSKIKLKYLAKELDLADKAFTTAKKRYFSLQGDLVDLRESFNNLSRTQTEMINTRTQLLQAYGAKALLNGGG